MRYIKLFEYYNNYYYEINTEDFHLLVDVNKSSTSIILNEDEIDEIKNIYPSVKRGDLNNLFIDGKSLYIIIHPLKDEWFAIYFCNAPENCPDIDSFNSWYESHEKYFKCDQFDGLIKCLKDLKTKF